MKYKILFFLFFVTLSIISQKIKFDKSDIYGCWTDSFEEYSDESSFKIFRQCSYDKIPPTRFRYRYEIKKNGEFHWLEMSKNDGHFIRKGHWTFDSKSKTLSVFNKKKNKIKELIIINMAEGMMKIERN
ncbi:hypothetical protein [Tenacibaculum geojense]|uniref:Lipocalin-like domain-containing protein n=1 Tax=Tenacibaculum geojense TaxID=915352 RepID=A0ABW3JPG9_9FLAO